MDTPPAAEIERNPLERAAPSEPVSSEPAQHPSPPAEASLSPQPFAEELPPDFWGDDLELPDAPQTARDAPEERFEETFSSPSRSSQAARTSAPQTTTVNPTEEGLEADPRFALLQSLFPGYISDFQPAEAPAQAAPDPLEDAPETPETVDLDEGLDADEGEDDG